MSAQGTGQHPWVASAEITLEMHSALVNRAVRTIETRRHP